MREVVPGPYEREMLAQCCHIADALDGLQAAVDRDGVMVRKDLASGPRPNPALAEMRAQHALYLRLVKQISARPGMPVELAETFGRLLPGA
jgi:hypothetical protein